MLLLSEEFQVTPENEKTNIRFPFTVPEDTVSLKITFSYDPKVLEDDQRAKLLIENNIKTAISFFIIIKAPFFLILL